MVSFLQRLSGLARKILYFDVETTGTNAIKQDIIQLSGIIEIGGKVVDEFDYQVAPFDFNTIDPQALIVNGKTIPEITKYPNGKVVHKSLVDKLSRHIDRYDKNDKFYPAGYNVGFDLDFLNEFFKKNGDEFFGSWQNWRAIDPLPFLRMQDCLGLIHLPDYKLGTVCGHFGIEIKAHDSLSDIRATREIIRKVFESISATVL